jgi:hypothetical protein
LPNLIICAIALGDERPPISMTYCFSFGGRWHAVSPCRGKGNIQQQAASTHSVIKWTPHVIGALKVHEDSIFYIRLAITKKLQPIGA